MKEEALQFFVASFAATSLKKAKGLKFDNRSMSGWCNPIKRIILKIWGANKHIWDKPLHH